MWGPESITERFEQYRLNSPVPCISAGSRTIFVPVIRGSVLTSIPDAGCVESTAADKLSFLILNSNRLGSFTEILAGTGFILIDKLCDVVVGRNFLGCCGTNREHMHGCTDERVRDERCKHCKL